MVEEQDGALLLNFTVPEASLSELSGAQNFTFFPDEWGITLNAATQENSLNGNTLTLNLRRDTRGLQELGGQITGIVSYHSPDGALHGASKCRFRFRQALRL